MKVYGIGFHEIALLRPNLEMEANAEVGAWPKVGKAGEGLQQIHRYFIHEDFASLRCISYSLLSVLVCRRHFPMKERAGHYCIVVALVKLVQIVF
jgi:hypothetical protein